LSLDSARPLRDAGTRVAVGLALAVLALWSLAAFSHETDQYTVPVGREFADLGPRLSRTVYGALLDAVNGTNAAIHRSVRDAHPDETARLQSSDAIAGEVWLQLFLAFPFNESLDGSLASEQTRAHFPGLITAYRPEQSIYDDPVMLLDVTKLTRAITRARTISVGGTLIGTDKIIHFIHLGRIYHSTYLSALRRGSSEAGAVQRAVQLSTGGNLFLSENTLLGMLSTGVRSNADLAANYAGFKFYRNLTEPVHIGLKVMPPMLVRRGPYWQLNDQVQPDSDFFTAFITLHWNEALNPSVYAIITDQRVRAMLRDRCPDVLDWYRDERGQPLGRRQFEALERELSTLYGEQYGYENDGKSTVSIATTCFPSEQPGGAETSSVGLDRHERQAPVVDQFRRTRLWWAARHGQVDEVKRLLEEGDDPNAVDVDGETPLHAAARWGRAEVVEVLLAHAADPEAKGLYGMTPLQVAVVEAQAGAARVLLRNRANSNSRDLFGRSSLYYAAARGNRDLVALLLEHGADPRMADDRGTTPLHIAARLGSPALVEALLARGANPTARNATGATPYDEAKQRGNKAILRQLAAVRPAQPPVHAIAEAPGNARAAGRE
jgi:ankyrin repeat protein